MTATALKSLLYTYLAYLRAPGGAEEIGFLLTSHIGQLDILEMYGYDVTLRDLPIVSYCVPSREDRAGEPTLDGVSNVLPDRGGSE